MTGYFVSIARTSKNLTAKERILLKDTTSALKLDEVTQVEPIIIKLSMWAELDIHNEMSDNKDYKNYILVDEDGTKYVTGSSSFWSSFMDIVDEITDMEADGEEWALKVYRMDSKNYKGKQFITCSIV